MLRRYLFIVTLIIPIHWGYCAELSEQQASDYHQLLEETRCVTCLNQNLLDSSAPVALAMREEILSQIEQGHTVVEIRDFLVSRYGEFVSFRPAMSFQNLILWCFPWALMVGALGIVWHRTRPNRR